MQLLRSTMPMICTELWMYVFAHAHKLLNEYNLLQCADVGAQEWLSHLIGTVVNARKSVAQSQMNALAELAGLRDSIDPLSDRDRFISAHHSTFELPRKFEFRLIKLESTTCKLSTFQTTSCRHRDKYQSN